MNTPTFSASIYGASGYAGAELLRYLSSHPNIRVASTHADSNAGRQVSDLHPHLLSYSVLESSEPNFEVDIAFLALPHGAAAATGELLCDRGVRVVDLSADWRLANPSSYEQWYGWQHPNPAGLSRWVYGLPELNRDLICKTDRVANPGCYPTASLLALSPLIKSGVIDTDGIVISAMSGVSGAGRKIDAGYLFTELDSSANAYGLPRHRHTPEIEQELSAVSGTNVEITFVPHLVPMARGMLATCVARIRTDPAEVHEALAEAYKDEPFVHVVQTQPKTKQASGTNHAFVACEIDERTARVIVTCAIDNLGKGAAGQAIQNANLMLGLDETTGLKHLGVYP